MAGVADRRTARAGKTAYTSNKLGEAIPVPHDGGCPKKYQQPQLSGNGELPYCAVKGIVTRSKRLPGPPKNLA